MNRLFLGSMAIVTAGLLVGCGQQSAAPVPAHSSTTSYGYRSAPPSTQQRPTASQPARYGQLPPRSESAGQVESVQGFPPGHPLHQDNSYQDELAQSPEANHSTSGDYSAHEAGIPQHDPATNTSLPHTNLNY